MKTLFLSDLHLSESTVLNNQRFKAFLSGPARHADNIYILGDLFDFWVGDDDIRPFATDIINALKALTQSGVDCHFVRGNRDFLVGKRFARRTGVQILSEMTTIEHAELQILVGHGDLLCTDDVRYLEFRRKVDQKWLQWVFNRLPFSWRVNIAKNVQGKTRNDKASKSFDIMDVNEQEVIRVMEEHHVSLMIHGHTHRPNTHQVQLNNGVGKRIVLSDWDHSPSYLELLDGKITTVAIE